MKKYLSYYVFLLLLLSACSPAENMDVINCTFNTLNVCLAEIDAGRNTNLISENSVIMFRFEGGVLNQINQIIVYQNEDGDLECKDGRVVEEDYDCLSTPEFMVMRLNLLNFTQCPELNTLTPKQNFIDGKYYVYLEDEMKFGDWEIDCDSLLCSFNCRGGEEPGENLNYYYCGKSTMFPIKLVSYVTNHKNVIVDTYEKYAVVTFDENMQHLETQCFDDRTDVD